MTAEDLRVRFGSTEVLRGVDLAVREGDLYGLLGRNGAGKTTAMRALLGYLPGFGGHCRVFGVPSQGLERLEVPLGVALDPPGLDDSLTVRQNLELARIRGGIEGGRSVDEVLELVRLTHRQSNRGGRLSHGQGRRAAVARALLGAPKLLVLDEPLSGLDPEGVEELLELFRRLVREDGVTIVFSSHHLREVEEVCNRVGLIEEGRVILEGESRALLAEAGDGLVVRCHEPEEALRLLREEPAVSELRHLGGGEIRGRVEGDADLAPLLARLAAAGIGLHEFHRDRASLVDVFRRAVA